MVRDLMTGIKLPNGRVVYLDANDDDTDDDGLTDFQETGLIYNVDDHYIGNFMTKDVKYFRMHSDPTEADTDGDGISDDVDVNPWLSDEIVIEIDKNHGFQYLNIVDKNGDFTDAGNQNWWEVKTNNKDKTVENFIRDMNSRLWHMGCGVIAMTDLEIYLAQKNAYRFTYPLYTEEFNEETDAPSYDPNTGCMDRDEYMSYVEYNSLYKYGLTAVVQYLTGVYPWNMESGIREFMIRNGDENKYVLWAPYTLQCATDERIAVAEQMELMLSRNIPVVLAYYTNDSDKELSVYRSVDEAKNRKAQYVKPEKVSGHYMTVIGLVKYLNAEGTSYNYIMKVASWGEIYYINYQDYSKNLSYFTNILSIGKVHE